MNETKRTGKEIALRYLFFTISLFFIALGVSLITRALIGTSPISSIPYVLSLHSPLSMGVFILLLNVVLIIGQMMMLGIEGIKRCKVELVMQLPVSVVFGLFVDFTMALTGHWQPEAYYLCFASLLTGCVSIGIGIAIEVISDVSMVSGEYFVSIATKRSGREFGTVKIIFDVSLVVIAAALSLLFAGRIDGIREGTLTAAILTGPLVKLFMPRLRFIERLIARGAGTSQEEIHGIGPSRHPVITIAREYGSGGHDIGEAIAGRLGIPFYDNKLMELAAAESGMSESTVRRYNQRLPHTLLYELVLQDYSAGIDDSLAPEDALFVAQSRVIRKLASEGACVIVGRCSDYVLRDNPNCIHIFLHASADFKERRAIEVDGIAPEKAAGHVSDQNAARAAHYAYYTGKRWDNPRNYDMVFDSSKVGAEAICEAVCSAYACRIRPVAPALS